MPARITPLRLEAFDQLPKHARRCVFWELDPSTLNGPGRRDQLADPEFEKEAWLSMVMLEWGCCGQLAVADSSNDVYDDESIPPRPSDDHCLGFAFYAPPRAVPRARLFPSGPVSADAVLLTSLGAESGADADAVTRELVTSVVTDLVRRGVRALEAFGRTAETLHWTASHQEVDTVPTELLDAVEVLGDCSVEHCVIDADFLIDAGFTVVAPHRYFPRLRLQLEQGLGWKADVEAALERLLESAQLEPAAASLAPVAATQVCRQP